MWTSAFLKVAAAMALLVAAPLVTVRYLDRPGLMLLSLGSGGLGYLLALLANHRAWMRLEKIRREQFAASLHGIRMSGEAPIGLQGQEADASRYRRLDDSLRAYCEFLLASEG